MSTLERQQDPGEHGYGGVEQEPSPPDASPDNTQEHPQEDPSETERELPEQALNGEVAPGALRVPGSG